MSLSFSGSCIHDTNLNNSLPVIQKILADGGKQDKL